MYLSKIRVQNYKSFRDSGYVEFKPGINIIVGQNNSGKTSLLEALGLRATRKPHKNTSTKRKMTLWQHGTRIPNDEDLPIIDGSIKIEPVDFEALEDEIIWLDAGLLGSSMDNCNQVIASFKDYFNTPFEIHFSCDGLNVTSANISQILCANHAYHYLTQFRIKENDLETIGPGSNASQGDNFFYSVARTFKENLYRFKAERICSEPAILGHETKLKDDASNLAEVINQLQSNNLDAFEKFNELISLILPSIKTVSTSKIKDHPSSLAGDWGQVQIWTSDKSARTPESAFSLDECGSGVGQILAMIYVLVTSEETPRAIMIDEPNSFLHPAASKKLIQILKQYPQHQYFISTHSPEILSTAEPATITMLKYEDGESKVQSLNLREGSDKLRLVQELGMEMSDFFFAQNVIWVEGSTEAKALPLILKKEKPLFDFITVPLASTDDLKDKKQGRKHAKTIIKNMEVLSGQYALTPPEVFIILDREVTDEREINDLQKLGMKFIPRRMFENYLLEPTAITKVLNDEIIDANLKCTVEDVAKWIEAKRNEKFITKKETSDHVLSPEEWINCVHAAELLDRLFIECSGVTAEYQKTTHSVRLTEELLKNNPEHLRELREFLLGVLESK